MQIQVNTDSSIEAHQELISQVETELEEALSRFSGHLTRLEVHLADEHIGKSGAADKRCMLEARPAGQQPVAVTHHAATVREACSGAAHKMTHLLESRFGRQDEHRGGPASASGLSAI